MANFEWSPIKDFKFKVRAKGDVASSSEKMWFFDSDKGSVFGYAVQYHQNYDNGGISLKKGDIVFENGTGVLFEKVTHFMPQAIPGKPKKETEQNEQN